jgi:hypothetical protein
VTRNPYARKEPVVTTSIKLLALALFLSLMPVSSMADGPPPIPDGGLNFYADAPCTDTETGQQGHCYFGQARDGKRYMTFYQFDTLMFIREILSQTDYKTVWTNPLFVSV